MTEPPPRLEQVRDAVLAAEEDRLEVDVLHALPGLERRCRAPRRRRSGEMPALLNSTSMRRTPRARCAYMLAHRVLVGDVDGERRGRPARRRQVDADDRRALVAGSASTVAAPMPPAAPVTTQTLPVEPRHHASVA